MLVLSLLLLSATPAPLRVAVPAFNVINVQQESADFFMDRFATQLRKKGLAVTTATEMQTMLGLERQKELLGCSETSTSCQAEIASALGADGIVRARIARFGQRFELSLTLIDPVGGSAIASISSSAADEGKVLDALDAAADELSAKFFAAKRPNAAPIPAVVTAAPSTGRPLWVPLIPLGLGIGAGIYGAVRLAASYEKVPMIADPNNLTPEVTWQQARDDRALGITLLSVGAVGLATAGILFFTGRAPAVTPVAALSPSGGWLGVEGRLP